MLTLSSNSCHVEIKPEEEISDKIVRVVENNVVLRLLLQFVFITLLKNWKLAK
jgi:hypothetical protein